MQSVEFSFELIAQKDKARLGKIITPKGIIDKFDLFNLDLTETTNYGHFGKANMPWEQIDLWT